MGMRYLKKVNLTTKVRLLALVMLMTLIFALAISSTYFSARDNLAEQSRKSVADSAQALKIQTETLYEETEALLSLFSPSPVLLSNGCSKFLSTLMQEPFINKRYSGFALINRQGTVICSSLGEIAKRDGLDKLAMFQNAFKNKAFTLGKLQLGQLSNSFVMPAGKPIQSADGSQYLFATAIKAEAFQNIFELHPMSDASGAFLISSKGNIIAAKHTLGFKYWFGKSITASNIYDRMHKDKSGTGKGLGLDNMIRFYAFDQIDNNQQHWHILMTVEESEVLADFFGKLTGPVAISAGIVSFSVLLMLLTVYLFFVRNLEKLRDTTNAIISGITWSNETLPKPVNASKWTQMTEIQNVTHNMQLIRSMLDERTQDLFQSRKIAKICSWKYHAKQELFSFSTDYENVLPIKNLTSLYSDDFLNCLPEEDRELLAFKLKTLCADLQPFVVVISFNPEQNFTTGAVRYLELHGEKALNSSNSAVSYLGTIQDVTEATRWRKALQRSEHFLQAVLDNLGESVVACDANGSLKVYNKVTETLHGLSVKDVPLNEIPSYYSMYSEDGAAMLTSDEVPLFRALSGEVFSNERFRVVPKNLPYRIVQVHGQPIKGENKEIIGAVVVQEDITAKLAAESRVKQSEDEFKLVFESGIDALLVVDSQGKILLANNSAGKLYGYNQQNLLGKNIELLFQEKDWGKVQAAREDASEENPVPLEFETRHSNGKLISAELVTASMMLRGQKAYFNILRDISERKLVAERINSLQRVEAVGKLTSGIAHDFNNLLQVILMNLDILEDELADRPDLHQMLQSAQKASMKGGDLIKHLQAFTRQQALTLQQVEINQQISTVMGFLDSLVRKNLQVDIAKSDQPIWVNVDAAQLEIVLTHLIMNTIDATQGEGKISLAVSKVSLLDPLILDGMELAPGEYCRVMVKDDGPGMTEEVRKRAFEPFFTTKKIGQGSGLGLSMVFGFVQQSGGGMKIKSQLGAGTEVMLYFPLIVELSDVNS